MSYATLINRKLNSDALSINTIKKCELRALIVEDNQLIQLIHKEILTELNYVVDTVYSGEEALLKINNDYNLILLDIGLPGITGIETAIKIRKHENHIYTKIVAVTTRDKDDLNNICFSSGINEILTKPINIEQLKNIISKDARARNI